MRRYRLSCLAFVPLLTACSSMPFGAVPLASPSQASLIRGSSSPWDALYVVNYRSVAVYEAGTAKPTRTLHGQGMLQLKSIAFDSAGDAYVSSWGEGPKKVPSAIYVFRPGASAPFRKITKGIAEPWSLVVDGKDYLYVANTAKEKHTWHSVNRGVTVYAPGGDKPIRTITWKDGACEIESMSLGPNNALYVANGHDCTGAGVGNIEVYPRGTTIPSLTVAKGIYEPNQMAFDQDGTLYVASYHGVPIYPIRSSTPSMIINRRRVVYSTAVDRLGNLYALSDSLSIYARGKSKPSRIIHIGDTLDVALDPDQNVYVSANRDGCGIIGSTTHDACILVFQHGTLAPMYEIADFSTPYAISFGPR